MTATPSLTLTYFPVAARAGAIRDALKIGGVPFEDKHIDGEGLAALKAGGTLPWGQVPVMDIAPAFAGESGGRYCQSGALLRYAGKLSRLYPDEPLAALKIDEACDCVDDLLATTNASFREQDLGRKTALRDTMRETELPRDFARLEALIAKNGGRFLGGDSLSIADLKLWHAINKLTDGTLDGIPTTVADGFAGLKDWHARVATARAEAGV